MQIHPASKFPRRVLFALLFLTAAGPSFAASILDVGTQYRIRGVRYSKADYGASTNQDYAYYSQRALAYIGGRFSPNIELMTQFQALGVAGSSTSVTNGIVNPAGRRYPNTNFEPWMQWAYLKAQRLYDLPVDLTIGRQPITLGDGFILSDDDLGFTGVRLQSRLPIWGLQADAFTFKVADNFVSSNDTEVYGFEITKPRRAIRYQLAFITERHATGETEYIRPSEDRSAFPVGTDLTASRLTRSFYDFRVEGRLLEGGFYKAEFALQQGRVSRSSATLGSVDLSGYGFLISAGLFTRRSKYGPIEVHGSFGMGSGDSGSDGKDSSFRPSFAHRFDGLERSGFGEFYGATVYDALESSSNPRGLPPGHSGIRVIGAGVTAHPTQLVSVGIDYFIYDSLERSRFSPNNESSLGQEFDLGIGFAYTSYLTFRASAAFFNPGSAYNYREKARRFLVEAIGRF